jgi:hypothetical protein
MSNKSSNLIKHNEQLLFRLDRQPHPDPDILELRNTLIIRSNICRFLIKALGFSTVCCFALIFLQGFHAWGFEMDAILLKWLCGVTVAKSSVLFAFFTNAVWRKANKKPTRAKSSKGGL